jgi:hypothetical protein
VKGPPLPILRRAGLQANRRRSKINLPPRKPQDLGDSPARNESESAGVILLSYRMTKHYWRLILRQLILPPGFIGESLPYRAPYLSGVAEEAEAIGLICGKLDPEDFGGSERTVYVPLRLVSDVRRERVSGGAVTYFSYMLGPSIDYRGGRPWNSYSDAVRTAVVEGMRRRGVAGRDDDRVLVTPIDYYLPRLSPGEELDRWIALTRMLAGPDPYEDLGQAEEMHRRYSRVGYIRLASVDEFLQLRRSHGVPARRELPIAKGVIEIRSGAEIGVNVVTNIDPAVQPMDPFVYRLRASSDYFENLDDVSEISSGILMHRFLARTHLVFEGATHLRLAPEAPKDELPVYTPEVVFPVEIVWSVRLAWRIAGGVLTLLGLVFGYVSVLPDKELTDFIAGLMWALGLSSPKSVEAHRWWASFIAITLASSGIGMTLFQRAIRGKHEGR